VARIADSTRDNYPDDLKYVWDKLARDGAGRPANIFVAMGNNPALTRAYTRFGNVLWPECGLDARTREIVILRCAHLRHSVYEWHQHVRIGRVAGVTDDEIRAVRNWQHGEVFTAPERVLLAYVDSLAETDHPATDIYEALLAHYSPAAVVGITLLAAYYFMTAKFLGALEVAPEGEFVGWDL